MAKHVPPPPHYSRESTICRWAWLHILSTWGPRRARADTRPSFRTVVITRKGTESPTFITRQLFVKLFSVLITICHFLWVYELNCEGFRRHILAVKNEEISRFCARATIRHATVYSWTFGLRNTVYKRHTFTTSVLFFAKLAPSNHTVNKVQCVCCQYLGKEEARCFPRKITKNVDIKEGDTTLLTLHTAQRPWI